MQNEKSTLTVRELSETLGIGLATAYELVKENQFRTVRVGRRILISKIALQKWLEGDDN